ncbi:phosphatidate cytidylyltransferase [Polynucleobacter paneuropaeus]|uniref:Phosphatidate cytidylyltransferase n=1 Tax=Polynucleobacter paneuropaeus TaxID=2527775 RepID=A0A9Q7CTE3_9BURK|nr:phosphatidate cytidylyltransferase [Polynucleobacter paneuropaeus]AWW44275.1 phosphatidate cytidylyltransferase [Polynucleobacter paneuropaeus]AWW45885.1 phosphatidate cytidylyltransferase [Polynucleobacter paneuropaeus]MBT8521228.1 phosphatidate cytidylyltransferase [Polynucleobacter paneuropaeus]MBT8524528.1 phosphatidate cytidylyltransferase [Polynucleobacter paneuropaeus]MBT8538682.1 phosphatidate cytidylyltransferase [Polynucleobacter paneuropaeus]
MLKTRVITAIVLLTILLAVLFVLPPIYLGGFFLLLLMASAWEWSRLILPNQPWLAYFYASACLLIIAGLMLLHQPLGPFALMFVASIFWLLIAPLMLSRGLKINLKKWSAPYFILGLVLLPATWFSVMFLREIGLLFLLSTMALVWIADIGAYFVGKAIGKRRLAPEISPGKSIEGAVGGLVLCYIYAGLCTFYLAPTLTLFGVWTYRFGWLPMFLMVTALTFLSIFGDLFESQFKRLAGVKDSSRLLPGHGGVLDRVDALIPVMPIAVLLVGFL